MLRRHSEVVGLKRLPLAEGGLQRHHIQFLFQRKMAALGSHLQGLY